MSLNPDIAIEDLKRYVDAFDLVLSESAESIFRRVEDLGHQYDYHPEYRFFLCPILERVKKIQSVVIQKGGDPIAAAANLIQKIEGAAHNSLHDGYDLGYPPYSTSERHGDTRTRLADLAIAIARRNRHSRILDVDVVEALLEFHDECFPASTNEAWSSEELQTPFNTLAHVTGEYTRNLWVRFDDIRREFGFLDPASFRRMPVESAPPSARSAVLSLLNDYPDYWRNCFLVMSFETTPTHSLIHEALRTTLGKHSLNLLRADEKSYSDDLLTNIEAYIYGCSFAVAVYERFTSEVYNPNVSFEVGYITGLKKPVCLLKERTLKALHSDLMGKLYTEFDGQDIEGSLPPRIEKWLRDKGIIE